MSTITELKRQVSDRADIVRIIGRKVKLKRSGADYLGLCPYHTERTPSFTVSPTKRIFKCFGCGKAGDVIAFVMDQERLEFVAALQWIAAAESIPMALDVYDPQGNPKAMAWQKPREDIKFVDAAVVGQTLQAYASNPLYIYLAGVMGEARCAELFMRFYVGTARGAGTIFWQVDQFRRVRTAQKIHYGPDGHRIKTVPPKRLYTTDNGYVPCFFGEHQLLECSSETVVCLVESEKTAVIASAYLPTMGGYKCVWLACSGSNGMTDEKMWVLRGLRVCLVPDMHYTALAVWGALPMRKREVEGRMRIMEDGEEQADYVPVAARLQRLGCTVSFYLPLPADRTGRDIADLLLATGAPEEVVTDLVQDEPFG